MVCIYVFDIDGVLIDNSLRVEKFREAKGEISFYDRSLLETDKPRSVGISLLEDRLKKGLVIILTGRPKSTEKITKSQLMEVGINLSDVVLIMRPNAIKDPDLWKEEKILSLLEEGYEICEFHDDSEELLSSLKRKAKSIKLYLHKGENYIEF